MERNRLYVFLSMLVIIFFFSVSGFGSYLPEEAKDAVTRVGDTAQEVIKSIEKSLSEENKDATDSDGTVNATEKQLKSPLHCLKKKRVQRREKNRKSLY